MLEVFVAAITDLLDLAMLARRVLQKILCFSVSLTLDVAITEPAVLFFALAVMLVPALMLRGLTDARLIMRDAVTGLAFAGLLGIRLEAVIRVLFVIAIIFFSYFIIV
jgi:hypothetical protein